MYNKRRNTREICGRRVSGWRVAGFLAVISSAFVMWCSTSNSLTVKADQIDAVDNTEWAQSYNGPANCCEAAPKIALDKQGNVYITGKSTTARDSPGGPSNDGIATIKYDPEGNEVWVRRFDGPGYTLEVPNDIAVDGQGNVHVTGYAAGIDSQFLTLKYDTDGNLLWARYAGSPLYDYAVALYVDGKGNVYVTGREAYRFDPYNNPVFQFLTVKYDSDGTEIWQRTFETPQGKGAQAAAVKADDEGNVYVAGKGYLPSEPQNDGYDIFTVKYDVNGREQWVAQYTGDGPEYYNDDIPSKLRLDEEGNLFLLGTTGRGPGQSDVLILKYSDRGDLIQTILPNHPDNELSTDWAFDADGNIYALSLKIILLSDYPFYRFDVVTFKLAAEGNVIWRKVYASAGNGNDYGRGIVLDGKGGIYVGVDAQQGTTFNQNFVLVKYRAVDGMKESENSYDGPARDLDRLSGIAIDSEGHIYLTGDTQTASTSANSVDFLTLKVGSR